MTTPLDGPILVTGASGQLGRRIVEDLLDARGLPPGELIVTSRDPARLADLAARGVEVRAANFDSPDELARSFAGAKRALIISTTPEAPYVKGKRFRQQNAAIDAAVAAGVPHLFYTSAPNPEPGTPCFWKEDHYRTEQALIDSGATWTILRHWEWPDWHYSENWKPALESGRYVTGAGQGRIAHITREDTARADAGALLSGEVANRIVDITGPEALSADEIVVLLEELSGRRIAVEHISPEALGERLRASGLAPDFVPVFVALAQAIRLGLFDGVTDDAATLSGRPLTTMRAFLADTLAREGVAAPAVAR